MGGVDGNGAVGEKEVWKKRGWKCFNLVLFLGAASMACLGAFYLFSLFLLLLLVGTGWC